MLHNKYILCLLGDILLTEYSNENISCRFRYMCMLNKKFAKIVPGEFTMVTVVMTYDLIHMTMSSSNTTYIQNMMFIFCTLAAIFYYCWFGNELKLKVKSQLT